MFIIPTLMLALTGMIPIDPRIYLLATGVIAGLFVTPLLMLPNAFIADITDIDEEKQVIDAKQYISVHKD